MKWHKECQVLLLVAAGFAIVYFLPVGAARFDSAVLEALFLARWYARTHVLFSLVPAFFIAGAIAVFVSQRSVMNYLGPKARRWIAYGVASVSGSVLAACSCTVLPLFAGIYRLGAGLGPATTFLYAGPAVNILAIILTARVLGIQLGVARAVGAVIFSIVIGLIMEGIFRENEDNRSPAPVIIAPSQRAMWQNALILSCMVYILVFANWARSGDVRAVFLCCPDGLNIIEVTGSVVENDEDSLTIQTASGSWQKIPLDQVRDVRPLEPGAVRNIIYRFRWEIVVGLLAGLAVMLFAWSDAPERRELIESTWGFAKQILPLLLVGILVAGFLFGRVGQEGLIPARWVTQLVGGNSLGANLFASVVGALMYFATLTEIPILQGLLDSGMGQGPALALLLSGPALSLPNMLVIRSVMGTRRTLAFVLLVVAMSTATGIVYGALAAL